MIIETGINEYNDKKLKVIYKNKAIELVTHKKTKTNVMLLNKEITESTFILPVLDSSFVPTIGGVYFFSKQSKIKRLIIDSLSNYKIISFRKNVLPSLKCLDFSNYNGNQQSINEFIASLILKHDYLQELFFQNKFIDVVLPNKKTRSYIFDYNSIMVFLKDFSQKYFEKYETKNNIIAFLSSDHIDALNDRHKKKAAYSFIVSQLKQFNELSTNYDFSTGFIIEKYDKFSQDYYKTGIVVNRNGKINCICTFPYCSHHECEHINGVLIWLKNKYFKKEIDYEKELFFMSDNILTKKGSTRLINGKEFNSINNDLLMDSRENVEIIKEYLSKSFDISPIDTMKDYGCFKKWLYSSYIRDLFSFLKLNWVFNCSSFEELISHLLKAGVTCYVYELNRSGDLNETCIAIYQEHFFEVTPDCFDFEVGIDNDRVCLRFIKISSLRKIDFEQMKKNRVAGFANIKSFCFIKIKNSYWLVSLSLF